MKIDAIVLNLKRRHLNDYQKAEYALKLEELYKADPLEVRRKQKLNARNQHSEPCFSNEKQP